MTNDRALHAGYEQSPANTLSTAMQTLIFLHMLRYGSRFQPLTKYRKAIPAMHRRISVHHLRGVNPSNFPVSSPSVFSPIHYPHFVSHQVHRFPHLHHFPILRPFVLLSHAFRAYTAKIDLRSLEESS